MTLIHCAAAHYAARYSVQQVRLRHFKVCSRINKMTRNHERHNTK